MQSGKQVAGKAFNKWQQQQFLADFKIGSHWIKPVDDQVWTYPHQGNRYKTHQGFRVAPYEPNDQKPNSQLRFIDQTASQGAGQEPFFTECTPPGCL